jgi:two-component system cell cycle response regulator
MIEINKNLKKLNILYVEDDESVNMIFSTIFKKYVKNIYSALNGEEGLEIFKKHHIDIVISDIQMPKMSGIEMAKKIREIDEEVPIVFTTAFGDSTYLKEAIEIGVDAYILKPIDKEKILKKINKIADNLVLKKELENYIKLMKIVFDYQTSGLILLDENYDIVFYNKAAEKIIKTTNSEAVFNFIKPKIIESLKKGTSNLNEVLAISYNDRFCDLKIIKVDDYILINCIDVTHLKKEIEEIEDKSLKDELTGAYNRKKIDKIIDELNNKEICLIIFDIDNFKKINDTYGHLKGDEVLQKLSNEVKKHLRSDDIFVRWGGEEFIVLLKNSTLKNAQKIAEKLKNVINSIEIDEVGNFSCSFGVACGFIENKSDFDKILKKSDDALYLAKNNGKNRVEVYWE